MNFEFEESRKRISPIFSLVSILFIGLIERPECDHPLRTDIATEFQKDYKSFVKSAEDHAKKHAPRS